MCFLSQCRSTLCRQFWIEANLVFAVALAASPHYHCSNSKLDRVAMAMDGFSKKLALSFDLAAATLYRNKEKPGGSA